MVFGSKTPKKTYTTLGIVNDKILSTTDSSVTDAPPAAAEPERKGLKFQENPIADVQGLSLAPTPPPAPADPEAHSDTASALVNEAFDSPKDNTKKENETAKKRMSVAFKKSDAVQKGNATTLQDYIPMSDEGNEIAIVEGEKVSILHGDEKWTCIIKANGVTGFVPTQYLDYENGGVPAQPPKGEAPVLIFAERTRGETWIDTEGVPEPPPPTPGSVFLPGNHSNDTSRTKGGTVMNYDAELGYFVKSSSELRVMEYNDMTGKWGTARPRVSTIHVVTPAAAATLYKKVKSEPIPEPPAKINVGNINHDTSRTAGGTVMNYDANVGHFVKAPAQYRVMEYNDDTGKWGTAKPRARLDTAYLMSPANDPPNFTPK